MLSASFRSLVCPKCFRISHFSCLQKMAMSAGRGHFRCPACANNQEFVGETVKVRSNISTFQACVMDYCVSSSLFIAWHLCPRKRRFLGRPAVRGVLQLHEDGQTAPEVRHQELQLPEGSRIPHGGHRLGDHPLLALRTQGGAHQVRKTQEEVSGFRLRGPQRTTRFCFSLRIRTGLRQLLFERRGRSGRYSATTKFSKKTQNFRGQKQKQPKKIENGSVARA